jgi:hypothetical protein
LKKSLSIPITSRVFPAPSCTNFTVLGLILKSSIHYELILIQGDKDRSSFSVLQMDNHFSQQHLLKRLSFLHCIFLWLCQNKVEIVVWLHIQVPYSIPLVFKSVFVAVPGYFYCYCFVI